MDNDVGTSVRVSPRDAIMMATCIGFGLNAGWYAIDSAAHIVARLVMWWHG